VVAPGGAEEDPGDLRQLLRVGQPAHALVEAHQLRGPAQLQGASSGSGPAAAATA
jgi:hypothetical protein